MTGTLHGSVKDPYGAVLISTIEIVPDVPSGNDKPPLTVSTDPFGKYSAELTTGQYKVCARVQGAEENCHCIKIDEGRDAEVNFSMRPDKAYILPTDYDVMDRRLQLLAGAGAINCGHVHLHRSPRNETKCALGAFRRKKPFYVRYDVGCIDCDLAGGLAADNLGRIFSVSYGSMGINDPGISPAEMMPDGGFHRSCSVSTTPWLASYTRRQAQLLQQTE